MRPPAGPCLLTFSQSEVNSNREKLELGFTEHTLSLPIPAKNVPLSNTFKGI